MYVVKCEVFIHVVCIARINLYIVLQVLVPVIDGDLFAIKAETRRRDFCLVVPQQCRLSQTRLRNLR